MLLCWLLVTSDGRGRRFSTTQMSWYRSEQDDVDENENQPKGQNTTEEEEY